MAVARRGSSQALAATALTAAASLACLIYDPRAPAFDAKATIALAVTIGALGMSARRLVKRDLLASTGLLAWLGFVGWEAVSALWSGAPGWLELGPWVAACGLAIAMLGLDASVARRCAGDTALVVGGVSSLAALAEFASGARGILVHGGQGNGNWLGLMLALAIPLSVERTTVAFRTRDRFAFGLVVLVALQVAALLVCESRTAWIALAAGALAALASRVRRATLAVCAAILVLLVLAAPAADALGAGSGNGDEPAAMTVSDAWRGRQWIWGTSLDVAVEHLPLGVGLGGFGHAFLEEQGKRLSRLTAPEAARTFENATTAHDDWLQAAAESGAPGLSLLLLAMAGTVLAIRKAGWQAGVASMVALGVCAIGDSPLRQPAVVVLLGLMLGAAPRERKLGRARLAAAGLVVTASAWLLAASTARWLTDSWETEARDAAPARQLHLLERAVKLDPASGAAWLGLGLAKLDRGDCEGAIDALDRSSRRLANVGTHVALGNALMDCGQTAQAAAAYEGALRLHPGGFRARANLVEALRLLKRYDEARRQLHVARSIYPGHPKLREMADRLERSAIDEAE